MGDRTLVQRLARLRVPSGFLLGALVLWLAEPTMTTIIVGSLVALIGEGLRVWAAGHLNKACEVTASGPYRWLPHPLYVGSSIIGLGLSIASANVVVFAIVGLYLAVTVTAAVKNEEAFLRATFGGRYDEYRRGAGANGAQRFSLARAKANHEHRAIAGLALAVLLLVLKATYNGVFWRSAG